MTIMTILTMMMMMIVKPMLIMTGADGDGNVRNGTDDHLIMTEAEGVLMSDFNDDSDDVVHTDDIDDTDSNWNQLWKR